MKASIFVSNLRLTSIFITAVLLLGCQSTVGDGSAVHQFTVLYTNDEHGWMEGVEEGRSAANLYDLWQTREGYVPDGPFLVLSGGDNWTGPAISTWVEGESMVDVMNAMNYDASALGNHEFDFGLESLTTRTREANFPYLSANTVWKASGDYPRDLGILPFSIETVAGLDIAIIGLTTRATATSTMPSIVAPLAFTDYEAALRKVMPSVQRQRPDMIIVISHVCMNELRPLAVQVKDLDIALMGGGHCNELVAEQIGDTVILGGGYHFTSYAKAVLAYDKDSKTQSVISYSTQENRSAPEDRDIAELIDRWRSVSEQTLAQYLGYSGADWSSSSPELQQTIIDSWLAFDPSADVAITNGGGIRAPLSRGEITLGTVVAILPFSNTIVATHLDGDELKQLLEDANRPVIGGLHREGGSWIVNRTGMPIRDTDNYRVLVNSFMYDGGDGYAQLAEFDPEGMDTAVHYREPFVQWLKAKGSSANNPLQLD